LSSNDPNLQNIPVRTAEGRRIREAFIASPGNVIVSADYSQIELRIMAHLSEDPAMLRAFAAGDDIHRATAAEIFGVSLDEVQAEQRRAAKVINFGLTICDSKPSRTDSLRRYLVDACGCPKSIHPTGRVDRLLNALRSMPRCRGQQQT
jgi:hypothetical protein